jgi:hypothetical protein
MTQRFNYEGRKCPRCYRPNLVARAGLYECVDGCAARFKFIAETNDKVATLERVVDEDAYNAGARKADDLICQCCGARGHSEVTCSQRCQNERSPR